MLAQAHYIRHCSSWMGDARLFRLEPPLNRNGTQVEYVVVSAVVVRGSGPETYIFAADADGAVLNWDEMSGSFRGDLDHERALSGLGFVKAA